MPATAIVIFAFNRPEHLKQTLKHLAAAQGVENLPVRFFIDGPRNEKDQAQVEEVARLAENFTHPDKLISRKERNAGLRSSVIEGLNEIFAQFDQAIILEDDILVHPQFLNYHLSCLQTYAGRKDIWSISGYVIPVLGKKAEQITGMKLFLGPRASSWGWSTWKNRWNQAEWDDASIMAHLRKNFFRYIDTGGDKLRMLMRELTGNSSSWAIRWDYTHFMHQASCVYPTVSLVENIGLDSSGTHSEPTEAYKADLTGVIQTPAPDAKVSAHPEVIKQFSILNRKWYRTPIDWIRFLGMWVKFS